MGTRLVARRLLGARGRLHIASPLAHPWFHARGTAAALMIATDVVVVANNEPMIASAIEPDLVATPDPTTTPTSSVMVVWLNYTWTH